MILVNYMESKKRTIMKTLTWGSMGLLVLGSIIYYTTGDWSKVGIITMIYQFFRISMYYAHERFWAYTTWGREVQFSKESGSSMPAPVPDN